MDPCHLPTFGWRSALVRSTGRKWVSRDAQLPTGWKLSVTNELWDSGWERKTQIWSWGAQWQQGTLWALSLGLIQGTFKVCLCQRQQRTGSGDPWTTRAVSVAPGLRAGALEEGSAPTHQPPLRTSRSKGSILEPGEDVGVHYMTRQAACPAPFCSSKDVPPHHGSPQDWGAPGEQRWRAKPCLASSDHRGAAGTTDALLRFGNRSRGPPARRGPAAPARLRRELSPLSAPPRPHPGLRNGPARPRSTATWQELPRWGHCLGKRPSWRLLAPLSPAPAAAAEGGHVALPVSETGGGTARAAPIPAMEMASPPAESRCWALQRGVVCSPLAGTWG